MRKRILIFFLLFWVFPKIYGQVLHGPKEFFLQGIIVNGDTVPHISLAEITIRPKLTYKKRKDQKKFDRMIYNIKKAYPYALIAKKMLQHISDTLPYIEGEKAQKEYIKLVEKQMFDRYEKELMGLTVTQGKILIKLVDRETGKTGYEIVKELRGRFPAFFWQSLATLFGTNLKMEYDEDGDDKMMEDIVARIENGEL